MRCSIWVAFGALCLLLASSWLLPATTIEASPIAQQCRFYGAVGLAAWILSYRQLWERLKRREWLCLRLAGVSVLLLGLPLVLGEWVRDGISDISRAALFALVPFVVVAVATMRRTRARSQAVLCSGAGWFWRCFIAASIQLSGVDAWANHVRRSSAGDCSGRLCQ